MNEEVRKLLIEEFGFNTGMRLAGVVMPNITKDFEKKLKSSLVGAAVKEEYRFEDMNGAITLHGTKKADGTLVVTAVEVNSRKISL